jgi:hypothetical protein
MSIAARIVATWRNPRLVMRDHLAGGAREDRAIAVLMGAAGLSLVAQLPAMWRAVAITPEIPLEARLGAALMATLFLLPLIAYAIAGVSWVLLRVLGRRNVGGFATRIALFWAMLASTPLVLVHRVFEAILPLGSPLVTIAGLAAFGGFLYLWLAALAEAWRSAVATTTSLEGP